MLKEEEDRKKSALRRQLHLALGARLKLIKWAPSPQNIEYAKRFLLFYKFNCKSSKELNLEQLGEAIAEVQNLDGATLYRQILAIKETTERKDLMLITDLEIRKIVRISKHVLKLSTESFFKYLKQTIGREARIDELTLNEAALIIKRLEQWELKFRKLDRRTNHV